MSTPTSSIHDIKKWNDFKLIDFQPKAFEDYDVDIKIEYCGVCGSDVCAFCCIFLVSILTGHHRFTPLLAAGVNLTWHVNICALYHLS